MHDRGRAAYTGGAVYKLTYIPGAIALSVTSVQRLEARSYVFIDLLREHGQGHTAILEDRVVECAQIEPLAERGLSSLRSSTIWSSPIL
jgi:hypothetical protein